MMAKATKLTAVKPTTAKATKTKSPRSYWSGLEAEQVIQAVAAGDDIAEEAERLDVMIDPDTAMVWLRRNKHNRKVVNSLVMRFVEDMTAGRWPYTHQGIAFDRTGELLDGQHRLHAIVQSGCTVPMQVTVNMPPEIKKSIDQGRNRTTADVATLECRTQIEAKMAAVAVRMMSGIDKRQDRRPRAEQVDFIIKHLPAILFAVERLPQKARVAYAATRAVVARAWYSSDPFKLERFCQVLVDGGYGPNETIVFQLREWINQRGCRNKIDAQEIYARTEWTLRKFLDGECPVNLRRAEKELFHIPENGERQPGL